MEKRKDRRLLGVILSVILAVLLLGSPPLLSLWAKRERAYADSFERWFDEGEIQTSAANVDELEQLGLAEGTVDLKATNHADWIDRLELSGMQGLLNFYDYLKEGADNDGVDDFLIEDHTTDYKVTVATVNGTLTATDREDAGAQLKVIAQDIFAQYKPFAIAVYEAFDRDHPEVFWLGSTRRTSYSWHNNTTDGVNYSYTVTVSFVIRDIDDDFDVRAADYRDADTIRSDIVTRDSRVESILSAVEGQSVYEQVSYFNEVLTTTNEYNTGDLDLATKDCWECISALEGRTGTAGPVCEAYARAFKVLCDAVDIPCVLVDGYAKSSASDEGGAHMWNYVQVEGGWYAIDVTWNDPVGGNSGAESGQESTRWFLLGSESVVKNMTFLTSHPVLNRASSNGVSFTNGPVLSTTACANPFQAPAAVLSDIRVNNSTEAVTVIYGDTLTVSVYVTADGVPASTQTMLLLYDGTELARSTAATAGVYTLTYDTFNRGIPTGSNKALTLQFVGDRSVAGNHEEVSVTLQKASSSIAFDSATQTVIKGSHGVKITPPTVTLIGDDVFSGSISYSYVNLEDAHDTGMGLPTLTGSYRVTAYYNGDSWYNASTATVTLTVEREQKPAEEEPDPPADPIGGKTDSTDGEPPDTTAAEPYWLVLIKTNQTLFLIVGAVAGSLLLLCVIVVVAVKRSGKKGK